MSEPVNYVRELRLTNVRCFAEATLDLSDGEEGWARWTVILGENGRGKTTLLQMIGALHGDPVWIAHQYQSLSSSMPRAGQTSFDVRVTFAPHDSGPFIAQQDKPNTCGTENPPRGLAPLIAYGASRRAAKPSLAAEAHDNPPTETLFDPHAPLINAEEWLLRLDYAAKANPKGGLPASRIQAVLNLLTDLLPDVSDIDIIPPEDADGGHVLFTTPYGQLRLGQMSHGYQTMVTWIVDLAARLSKIYPSSKRPTHEPCIVLVDEIDLHLHPRWQRDLQDHLLTQFPKAQFIVTAHSPLMVQTALDQNLAVLADKGDHVEIENDPKVVRGWRVDQLLTSDLFGLDSGRPPHVARLLDERTKLVAAGTPKPASSQRIKAIDRALGDLPTASSPEEQHDLDELKRLASKLALELGQS